MSAWTRTFVAIEASLRDVLETIDVATLQIALVVDADQRLLGVITDGDVRRALLRGATLATPASEVMTRDPVTATPEMRLSAIERLMLDRELQQVPVVDDAGRVVSLALHGKLLPRERCDNEVFLMVGGLGSRFGSMTRHVPKPMLRIGDKPILEIILEGLLAQGFYRFRFAVHHRAEMIERYFGDGRQWAAEIAYLREPRQLGTCGGLCLIDTRPQEPFFVMNGDILAKVRYDEMLAFHAAHGGAATMAVREYTSQVPFGVARLDGNRVVDLVEKPTQSSLVNGGIYVLEPDCLDLIPKDTHHDMPSLLTTVIERGMGVYGYSIVDSWIDVGRPDDLDRAQAAYEAMRLADEALNT